MATKQWNIYIAKIESEIACGMAIMLSAIISITLEFNLLLSHEEHIDNLRNFKVNFKSMLLELECWMLECWMLECWQIHQPEVVIFLKIPQVSDT